VRILLADDHALLRRGLIGLLAEAYPHAEFGETATTAGTLAALERENWDVLVLDIFLPGRTGLEVLRETQRRWPRLPVLVVSTAPEEQMAVRVLRAGARGYLNKQAAPEDLVRAIDHVASGGRHISPAVAERLAEEITRDASGGPERLSDREFAVLHLLLTGRSIKEIAAELALSAKTVSTYHTRLWAKLKVSNDFELLQVASAQGLVNPPGTTLPSPL
jgi:two-component system invasion response regulator UvrY